MPLEDKDIMMVVAQAAGGATALGIGFVAVGAGLLGVAGQVGASKWLGRFGLLAFLMAMISSFLASGWFLGSKWNFDASILGVMYSVSVWAFIASMAVFLVVFVWLVVLLWRAKVTAVINLFGGNIS